MMRRLLPFAVLMLAACSPDLVDQTPDLGHPARIAERQLTADFDAIGTPLSEFDQRRLRLLALQSQQRGSGPIRLDGGDQTYLNEIQTILANAGARDFDIAPREPAGHVRVTVPVWAADLPVCGNFSRGVNPDYNNMPHSDWGCSFERNRAAMLQNPADLLHARVANGRDGNRSADVMGKYGAGIATGSAAESISAGSTSPVAH